MPEPVPYARAGQANYDIGMLIFTQNRPRVATWETELQRLLTQQPNWPA